MVFVMRDAGGRIVAVREQAGEEITEQLPADHPDVIEFLGRLRHIDAARDILSSSDVDTVRVIEDLVQVLVEKNLILLTDLPPAAQRKLVDRQRMRAEMGALDNLMVDEDDIL